MTEPTASPLAYLDTNVFIFIFEGAQDVSERVMPLLEPLRNHPGAAVTSELTLAEVLAESARPRGPMLKRAYLDLIVWSRVIELVPISREILYESVDLRVARRSAHGRKLDLPDATHLTTAIQKKRRYFVSADDGIGPPRQMKRISPITDSLDEVLKELS
jgi:predicted nucleic acid-binding protein